MNPWVKEIYMYILGALVVICDFAIVAVLVFRPIPVENKEIVMISIGILLGLSVNVVGYFYGSSKSSADKSEQMAKTGAGSPGTSTTSVQETKVESHQVIPPPTGAQ